MTKGFTLIELLVVIAIVAVLATAVVLTLNPAELIKQGRDATRISDLGTVQSALSYYLSTATTPDTSFGVSGFVARCMTATPPAGTFNGAAGVCTSNITRGVSGTGWVLAKLDDATGGSPLGALPADPLNNTTYYYAYAGNGEGTPSNLFELNGRLESDKYKTNMSTDGGDRNTCTTYVEATCWYELGLSLTM